MSYYDRIDVSERIGVNKTSESKECDLCCYWYFLNKGFKFRPNVCNGCHDLLMMSVSLIDIPILNIKSPGYCCIISKSEVINLIQNIYFLKKHKRGMYKKGMLYIFKTMFTIH